MDIHRSQYWCTLCARLRATAQAVFAATPSQKPSSAQERPAGAFSFTRASSSGMALRQAASSLCRQLRGQAATVQHQQQRFAGNLPVKPNKYVEEWGVRREHIEQEFRWDAKTITNIVLFIGVAPYLTYKVLVGEFDKVDKVAGRPPRAMVGTS